MSASNRHEDTGAVVPVYLCSTRKHLKRRRALLDGPVLDMARRALVGLADAGRLEVATRPDPTVEPLRAAIGEAEQRLDTLAALAADGDLDPLDFAAAAKRLRATIKEDTARLRRQEGRPATARLLTADGGVGAAFDALVERAHTGEPDMLRAVLRELFAEVVVEVSAAPAWPSVADVHVTWASWVPGTPPTRPEAGELHRTRLAIADRRREVARLRGEGLNIKAIAAELGVDRSTVRGDLRAS